MQRARLFVIAIFALVLSISTPLPISAQYTSDEVAGEELRPFDFRDKYYEENGVNPKMIISRRTGFDKYSVIDFIVSDIYKDVRIVGTWPMTDYKGDIFYIAPLGELPDKGFTENNQGRTAKEIAHFYPFYVFPSATAKNQERQAAVAETGKGYFEKNLLGLSVMVSVEFTSKAASKEGQVEIEKLLGKNGKTLDGTFSIRSVSEIDYLTRRGLVSQSFGDELRYKINRVIEDPTKGAISPDAFLITVLDENQKPLESEKMYFEQFECLQKTGDWCTVKK